MSILRFDEFLKENGLYEKYLNSLNEDRGKALRDIIKRVSNCTTPMDLLSSDFLITTSTFFNVQGRVDDTLPRLCFFDVMYFRTILRREYSSEEVKVIWGLSPIFEKEDK